MNRGNLFIVGVAPECAKELGIACEIVAHDEPLGLELRSIGVDDARLVARWAIAAGLQLGITSWSREVVPLTQQETYLLAQRHFDGPPATASSLFEGFCVVADVRSQIKRRKTNGR